MNNQQVAQTFITIAQMLEIQGESIHRVLSYRRAAENIAEMEGDVNDLWREGKLTDIPRVGKTLAAKIDELLRTGKLEFLERLAEQVPLGVVEMLQIPDVGPRTAARLWKELGLTRIEDVERAAQAGKIQALPRMGAKTEAKILAGIEALKRRTGRVSLGVAWPLAQAVLEELAAWPGVERCSASGELRRMRGTVEGVDLLAAAAPERIEAIMARFCQLPLAHEVLVRGPDESVWRTQDNLPVRLRVVPLSRWGTALQHFTGSEAHNARLLQRAQGLPESVYADETQLYASLGLPWIPPELREDRGELDGPLPDLITPDDMRGDLQMHSTWSDGANSIAELAQAALERGLEYILISDHSQSLAIAGGLSLDDLRRQREDIRAVNESLGGKLRVLAGVEVEVRADGSLDYPDEVLAELDLVLASLHTGLRTGREKTTARLLAAIHNPHVDIVAHPTGRLIGRREGADLDLEAIFRAAAETSTALEINADPNRLDLDDVHARRAVQLGVKLSIGSDTHRAEGVGALDYGIATARRGWVSTADVVNAWPLDKVLEWARRG